MKDLIGAWFVVLFLIFSVVSIVAMSAVPTNGPAPKPPILIQHWNCVEDQVKTYGDLCAESASGYEDMSGAEAHFEGVRCAVEGIKICLGDK